MYYLLIVQCSFQNAMIFSTGLSNLHNVIITLFSFIKLKAKETDYRDYKKLSSKLFRADLELSLDCTWFTFEDTLMKTLYAVIKTKSVWANQIP